MGNFYLAYNKTSHQKTTYQLRIHNLILKISMDSYKRQSQVLCFPFILVCLAQNQWFYISEYCDCYFFTVLVNVHEDILDFDVPMNDPLGMHNL